MLSEEIGRQPTVNLIQFTQVCANQVSHPAYCSLYTLHCNALLYYIDFIHASLQQSACNLHQTF